MEKMSKSKLIESVRIHECLYDLDCSNYKSIAWRQEAWEKVAEAMGAEVSECKENWLRLRRAFIDALTRRAKAGPNAVKWAYEDQMSFILPFIKKRRRLYDDDSTQSINKDEAQRNIPEYRVTTQPMKVIVTDNSLFKHFKLNTKKSNTRKRKIEEYTQKLNTKVTIMAKTTTQDKDGQEKDDIDLFFESLAKTVKKLPKLERIKLKWDIMKMVNDVEIRCLSNTKDIATNRSAQVASETDTRRDVSTFTSEPIASTSTSSTCIMPGQSLLKCKEEPSDPSPSPHNHTHDIENNALVEAHTLTIMGGSQTSTPPAPHNHKTFKKIIIPNLKVTPQTLPYITKVQSLSTLQEDPSKIELKKEFD